MANKVTINQIKGSDSLSKVYQKINENFNAIADALNVLLETSYSKEESNIGNSNSTISGNAGTFINATATRMKTESLQVKSIQRSAANIISVSATPVYEYYNHLNLTDATPSIETGKVTYMLNNDSANVNSDYVFVNDSVNDIEIKDGDNVIGTIAKGESISISCLSTGNNKKWYKI